jgi:hypothetical protein
MPNDQDKIMDFLGQLNYAMKDKAFDPSKLAEINNQQIANQ